MRLSPRTSTAAAGWLITPASGASERRGRRRGTDPSSRTHVAREHTGRCLAQLPSQRVRETPPHPARTPESDRRTGTHVGGDGGRQGPQAWRVLKGLNTQGPPDPAVPLQGPPLRGEWEPRSHAACTRVSTAASFCNSPKVEAAQCPPARGEATHVSPTRGRTVRP